MLRFSFLFLHLSICKSRNNYCDKSLNIPHLVTWIEETLSQKSVIIIRRMNKCLIICILFQFYSSLSCFVPLLLSSTLCCLYVPGIVFFSTSLLMVPLEKAVAQEIIPVWGKVVFSTRPWGVLLSKDSFT